MHIKGVGYKDSKKNTQSIYASILGNSQNSRLYKRIREELGFVYTIYAYSEITGTHGDIFIVFGTRPKNVKDAIFEIKKIIHELAENGVSEEELSCAKNLKKSIIEFSSETNTDRAETNASFMYYEGKHVSLNVRKTRFDKVTTQDVNKFAKKIANEKMFNIVAVGKNLNIEDLKQY